MKRYLIALSLATGLLVSGPFAHAETDDGSKLGTLAILSVSETVCETKLTPFMSNVKVVLAEDVSPKELMVVGAAVISSWKTRTDKNNWCANAAKNLKTLEAKFN